MATANLHKAEEIAALLGGFEVQPRPDWLGEIEETEDSFEGNSIKKARVVSDATGDFALADDSGLEVDALGGEPGVYSARYAGEGASDEQNLQKLLSALGPEEDRRARFVCIITLAYPDGSNYVFRGEAPGRISHAPSGSSGFGYDPIFVPDRGDGRTFAEMTQAEKSLLSHRSIAIGLLLEHLKGAEVSFGGAPLIDGLTEP